MSSNHKKNNRPEELEYLLEKVSPTDINRRKEITKNYLEYQWAYYAELSYQRKQIESEIKSVLNKNSVPNYKFHKWQRAVKYRYSLHPLCTKGSLTDPGGRFNIGDISEQTIPKFPALYIACDKETALQETLGRTSYKTKKSKLSFTELALMNPSSETIVSVSGTLDKVFALTNLKNLKSFSDLIKDFKISNEIKKQAKKLGLQEPILITSPSLLLKSLLDPDWRKASMQSDIPANSQIFGHLVSLAGIEGIVYPSSLNNKRCLAIFPENFVGTSSYIEIDDLPPQPKVSVPTRIDETNWKLTEQDYPEFVLQS